MAEVAFARISAYSKPTADGGVTVDVEGMAVDLIAVCKGVHVSKEAFLDLLGRTWDQVSVDVNMPPPDGASRRWLQ